jgi:hypothetical protein
LAAVAAAAPPAGTARRQRRQPWRRLRAAARPSTLRARLRRIQGGGWGDCRADLQEAILLELLCSDERAICFQLNVWPVFWKSYLNVYSGPLFAVDLLDRPSMQFGNFNILPIQSLQLCLSSEIISFENHCYTAYSVIAVMFEFRNYLLCKPLLYCLFSDCSYVWSQKKIKNCYLNVQVSAGWGLLLILFYCFSSCFHLSIKMR